MPAILRNHLQTQPRHLHIEHKESVFLPKNGLKEADKDLRERETTGYLAGYRCYGEAPRRFQ